MFKQLSKSKPGLAILAASRAGRTTIPHQPSSTVRWFAAKASTPAKHTADTYAKDDVDPTPPEDASVFRVDNSSEDVQKPHEAPSGPWSRAGVETEEYRHSDGTYKTEGGPGLRYGGKKEYDLEKGPETSGSSEGPEANSRGGRR